MPHTKLPQRHAGERAQPGDIVDVEVSAKNKTNLDRLLEMIALQADLLELKTNPDRPAEGTVIEAKLDRGRGPVATVLVQRGTLKVGDFVLAGAGFGKVRAMTNEHGKQVHEAGPSTPVEILGLSEVPGAGDPLHAVKDSKKAMEIADGRKGTPSQIVQGEVSLTTRLDRGAFNFAFRFGIMHYHVKHLNIDTKRASPMVTLSAGWFFDLGARRRRRAEREQGR